MKSVAVFIFIFGLAGAIVYYKEFTRKEVASLPAPPVSVPPVSAPPVSVPPVPVPPVPAPVQKPEVIAVAPDLKVIPVKNRPPITNARVQSINSDGIVFLCDDGMVQALFSDLPPGFRAYYAKKAEPVFVQDQPDQSGLAPPSNNDGPNRSFGSTQEEIEAQRAQKRQSTAWRISSLQGQIASEERTIQSYVTQSNFDNDRWHTNVTQSEYESAKSDLAQNKSELQQLESDAKND